MRPGSPGFVKERLKIAREARGLSGVALAEIVGVSRSAISQYENGEQTPSPSTLYEIASGLNLPVSYFLKPAPSLSTPVFYRSFAAATKASRIRSESRLKWLRELINSLGSFVTLPAVKLPSIDPPPENMDSDACAQLERAATQARRFWGLGDGPISNVVTLLENNGIIVVRHFLDSLKLDAFSVQEDAFCQRPVVILGADKGCAVRSRFDAAHELGHLLLHHSVSDVAKKLKVLEPQAHRFAGAFLLPAEAFKADVKTVSLEHLLLLKMRWGVSVGTMVHRLADLGVIDAEMEKNLWMKRAKRGWNKFEPFDDKVPVESPGLLQKCFDLVLGGGYEARDALMNLFPWNPREIEELAGLSPNTLTAPNQEAMGEPTIIRFPAF